VVLNATGAPRLALGLVGSRRTTSSIVQVLSLTRDRGASLSDAIAAPRSQELLGRSVWAEESMDPAARRGLWDRFLKVQMLKPLNYKLCAVQAIARDRDGGIQAAADPRRDGAAAWARRTDGGRELFGRREATSAGLARPAQTASRRSYFSFYSFEVYSKGFTALLPWNAVARPVDLAADRVSLAA